MDNNDNNNNQKVCEHIYGAVDREWKSGEYLLFGLQLLLHRRSRFFFFILFYCLSFINIK